MPKPSSTFRRRYVDPTPGRTLVAGSLVVEGKSDDRLLFDDAIGVDLQDGTGVDLVHDMERPLPEGTGPFAHVHCTSVLEHCRRPWLMAETIDRVMLDGSTIYVRVPTVWRHHDYPGDYWRFLSPSLAVLFPSVFWLETRYEDCFGDLHPANRLPALVSIDKAHWRCELHGFGVKGPTADYYRDIEAIYEAMT